MRVLITSGTAGSPGRGPSGATSHREFNVNEKGVVRDTFTFLPMSGPFLRKLILGPVSAARAI